MEFKEEFEEEVEFEEEEEFEFEEEEFEFEEEVLSSYSWRRSLQNTVPRSIGIQIPVEQA